MGDDSHVFFLVLGVCKENMEGSGKMRKDAKLSSTVPSVTPRTSKNQFAIFISLALRHKKRNKTHHKSEKKQLLVAQQIEVLKRGKKEKRKKHQKKNTTCELCIHLSTSIPKTSSLSYNSLTSTFKRNGYPRVLN